MAVLLQRHRVVVDVVVVAFVVRQGEKECVARVMNGNWPIVERRPLRGIGCTTVLYATAFQMEDEDAERGVLNAWLGDEFDDPLLDCLPSLVHRHKYH